MDKYEKLEYIAQDIKINKLVMPYGLDGFYYTNNIYMDENLSYKESVEVLAEEIGHHFTSTGNILDYKDMNNMKQEVKARRFGYELVMSLDDIIEMWKLGLHNLYEFAEHLEVTQSYVLKAIEHYKMKYGLSTFHGNYYIRFEPLNVYEYKKI
ncbi:ImmA/IrrE family metallo-endopeptidase [Macrococcoides goetzii]|nr:ImmA/IrrE family metallo-endopeptidase [Macrococcus goetzii]TDM48258.1 ImmA/IrrE family metallo-endopeptidase [Macrococcus goetzii]